MKSYIQIIAGVIIMAFTIASSCVKNEPIVEEEPKYCVYPDTTSPMPDPKTFQGERMAYCKVNDEHFHPIIDTTARRIVEEGWDKGSDIYNNNYYESMAAYRNKIGNDVPSSIGINFQKYLKNECVNRRIHFHFNAINVEKNKELRISNDFVISDSYKSRWFALDRSKPYFIKVLDIDFDTQRVKGEFAFTAVGDNGEVWEVTDGIFDLPFYYR